MYLDESLPHTQPRTSERSKTRQVGLSRELDFGIVEIQLPTCTVGRGAAVVRGTIVVGGAGYAIFVCRF